MTAQNKVFKEQSLILTYSHWASVHILYVHGKSVEKRLWSQWTRLEHQKWVKGDKIQKEESESSLVQVAASSMTLLLFNFTQKAAVHS